MPGGVADLSPKHPKLYYYNISVSFTTDQRGKRFLVRFTLCCVVSLFQFGLAHGHSPFPTVIRQGCQLRRQRFSSTCLSYLVAQPHVFIVYCHLSVKNAFVSIFTLCKLLKFMLLHPPSPSHFSLGRFITQDRQQ